MRGVAEAGNPIKCLKFVYPIKTNFTHKNEFLIQIYVPKHLMIAQSLLEGRSFDAPYRDRTTVSGIDPEEVKGKNEEFR